MLALYLLTCSHGTLAGVFRAPDGYICEDMQWTAERVSVTLSELLAKGFANRCETTKWVWIIKHLEWNPPENPNQRKSALKLANQIPDQCCWKSDYMRDCGELFGLEPTPKEPLPANPSETLPQPVTVTVAVTGEENTLVAGKPTTEICPQKEIISLYADALPELPQPRVWEGAREKNLTARWRWVLSDLKTKGKPHDREAGLGFFKRMFEYIHASDFLMGRTDGGWNADLGWIVKSENFAKIIQGNYENKEKAA